MVSRVPEMSLEAVQRDVCPPGLVVRICIKFVSW